MAPFTAEAEVIRNSADFDNTLRLRLQPLHAEVRVPLPPPSRQGSFRMKVDLARQLLRATHRQAAIALYRAVAGADAPEGFDWEQMDRDDLHDALAQNKDLTRRVEIKDAIIRRYRMFMEANGKSWEAIEKAQV